MRTATSVLLFSVLGLLGLGLVMLVSSATGRPEARYLMMQPVWCGVGLTALFVAAAVDYRLFKKYWWVLLSVAVILLGLLLIPDVGKRVKGATRWLDFGPVRFQPSELAKIALIVTLAWYGDRYQRHMHGLLRGFVVPCLVIGGVLVLVFLEPDFGTTVLLGGVGSAILLTAGLRWRYFLPPMIVGSLAIGLLIANDPVRAGRVHSWLHLEETKMDTGHQTYQSIVGLGAGGITGLGLGEGRQKLGFLPEHHTDFIFSVIGEELGLVATLAVLAAFLAILFSGLYIAWYASDTFGMLLASGITFLIAFQVFINIGVVTGVLPNKGLSLPFISYGGSNLVLMMGCVGLLLNVARHAGVRDAVPDLEPDSDTMALPQAV